MTLKGNAAVASTLTIFLPSKSGNKLTQGCPSTILFASKSSSTVVQGTVLGRNVSNVSNVDQTNSAMEMEAAQEVVNVFVKMGIQDQIVSYVFKDTILTRATIFIRIIHLQEQLVNLATDHAYIVGMKANKVAKFVSQDFHGYHHTVARI